MKSKKGVVPIFLLLLIVVLLFFFVTKVILGINGYDNNHVLSETTLGDDWVCASDSDFILEGSQYMVIDVRTPEAVEKYYNFKKDYLSDGSQISYAATSSGYLYVDLECVGTTWETVYFEPKGLQYSEELDHHFVLLNGDWFCGNNYDVQINEVYGCFKYDALYSEGKELMCSEYGISCELPLDEEIPDDGNTEESTIEDAEEQFVSAWYEDIWQKFVTFLKKLFGFGDEQ